MAGELHYTGSVDDSGKLKIVHRKAFDDDMANLAGKRLKITVSVLRKSKSNKQNAYYWGCVINFVLQGLAAQGYDRSMINKDVVHEYLCNKFLKFEVASQDTGEVLEFTREYHTLTTTQHMDYVAEIQIWAAEFLGIVIPDPETQSSFNFK